eukprot:scaffold25949_cov21-Tisochrysis_lutea.AAC.1
MGSTFEAITGMLPCMCGSVICTGTAHTVQHSKRLTQACFLLLSLPFELRALLCCAVPSTDGEAAHAMLTQAVRPLSADEYEVRGGAASDQQDRAESGHRAAPAAHQSSLQDDDPPASAARDRHTGMQGREGRAEVRGVRGMGGAGQNPNEAQHGWGVSSINAPNLAPSGLVVEEPAGAGDGPAAKPFRSVPQPGRHHAPTMSNSKSGAHWHSR